MAGDYTFILISDDGSRLFIDSQLVIENDGGWVGGWVGGWHSGCRSPPPPPQKKKPCEALCSFLIKQKGVGARQWRGKQGWGSPSQASVPRFATFRSRVPVTNPSCLPLHCAGPKGTLFEAPGTVTLTAGWHPITLLYAQGPDHYSVQLLWSSAAIPKQTVPENNLTPLCCDPLPFP